MQKLLRGIKHHGSAKGLKPVPTSSPRHLATDTQVTSPFQPVHVQISFWPRRYPLTCSSPWSRWSSTQVMMGLNLGQGKVHLTQVRMVGHLVIVVTQHRQHICSHPGNRSHPQPRPSLCSRTGHVPGRASSFMALQWSLTTHLSSRLRKRSTSLMPSLLGAPGILKLNEVISTLNRSIFLHPKKMKKKNEDENKISLSEKKKVSHTNQRNFKFSYDRTIN